MVIVFFEVVARFQDESPGWKKLSENLPGEIRKRLNLEEPSVKFATRWQHLTTAIHTCRTRKAEEQTKDDMDVDKMEMSHCGK